MLGSDQQLKDRCFITLTFNYSVFTSPDETQQCEVNAGSPGVGNRRQRPENIKESLKEDDTTSDTFK